MWNTTADTGIAGIIAADYSTRKHDLAWLRRGVRTVADVLSLADGKCHGSDRRSGAGAPPVRH
jgi:hypothetical protein